LGARCAASPTAGARPASTSTATPRSRMIHQQFIPFVETGHRTRFLPLCRGRHPWQSGGRALSPISSCLIITGVALFWNIVI
jgi:hypothetical protein